MSPSEWQSNAEASSSPQKQFPKASCSQARGAPRDLQMETQLSAVVDGAFLGEVLSPREDPLGIHVTVSRTMVRSYQGLFQDPPDPGEVMKVSLRHPSCQCHL